MAARLPEIIDPSHLADKRTELKGQLLLSALDRLCGLLHSDQGRVLVALRFYREGQRRLIHGQFEAQLSLVCQNCGGPLPWPMRGGFKLGMVESIAEADLLADDCEPLLLAEGQTMPLKAIVEDELLLALPIVPKHAYACFAAEHATDPATPAQADGQQHTPNPFAVLAQLKKPGEP